MLIKGTPDTVQYDPQDIHMVHATVKPVCNDHLDNKIYNLWFIQ